MELSSCFLSSFVEFHSAVAEEKEKMYHAIRGRRGHLVFPIGPKNINLIEDVECLLPVKFREIKKNNLSFVEFRSVVSEEKSKISQQIRGQDGHRYNPIGPKKRKLVGRL